MKVLAIGNSYSQDGTRYVHELAKSCGENINITNLHIGGCPLSRHYRNMLSDEKAYTHEFNGIDTGLKVSLKDVLLTTEWDVITIQQQSFNSTMYDTFQPYLTELVAFIRKCAPRQKLHYSKLGDTVMVNLTCVIMKMAVLCLRMLRQAMSWQQKKSELI